MDAEQFRKNVAHQQACIQNDDGSVDPEGILLLDVTKWEIVGVGKTLEEAIEWARDTDGCPYCDCGRDETNLHAYRLHPYAFDMLHSAGWGGNTPKEERLYWSAEESCFRWAGFGECPTCEGEGRHAGAGCATCDGDGCIEGDEDGTGWWNPPPEPPNGTVWQGARSRCLVKADERKRLHEEKMSAMDRQFREQAAARARHIERAGR